jgi:hypothetical protein
VLLLEFPGFSNSKIGIGAKAEISKKSADSI